MNMDELQVLWDSQNKQRLFAYDEEALHRMVRNQGNAFYKKILRRDITEIVACFIVIVSFTWIGLRAAERNDQSFLQFWPIFLISLAAIFVAAFLAIGRRRQARREAAFDNTVKGDLERALSRINQQVWLLRNVFWWYLLPFAAAFPFFVYATEDGDLRSAWGQIVTVAVVFPLLYGFNQWSLRKHLLPEKRELELLLTKLTQD